MIGINADHSFHIKVAVLVMVFVTRLFDPWVCGDFAVVVAFSSTMSTAGNVIKCRAAIAWEAGKDLSTHRFLHRSRTPTDELS